MGLSDNCERHKHTEINGVFGFLAVLTVCSKVPGMTMLFCLLFHEVDNSDFILNVSTILDEFYSVQS